MNPYATPNPYATALIACYHHLQFKKSRGARILFDAVNDLFVDYAMAHYA